MSRRTRNYARLIAYGAGHPHAGVPAYMLRSASMAVRMAAGGESIAERPPLRMPLSWRILWFVAKLAVALWATGYLVFALGLMWLMLTTKV